LGKAAVLTVGCHDWRKDKVSGREEEVRGGKTKGMRGQVSSQNVRVRARRKRKKRKDGGREEGRVSEGLKIWRREDLDLIGQLSSKALPAFVIWTFEKDQNRKRRNRLGGNRGGICSGQHFKNLKRYIANKPIHGGKEGDNYGTFRGKEMSQYQ